MARFSIALAVIVAITTIAAASADATHYFAYRVQQVGGPLKGTRVTIGNPSSGQAAVSSGDKLLTSSYADDGATGPSLMQQGVMLEHGAPANGCNLGSSAPSLYYFTEIQVDNNYHCFLTGNATYSTAHLQSVVRGNNGTWYSYIDGVATGITTVFRDCGGDACRLMAFAESAVSKPGKWSAKFGGSGNTPWQTWNGTSWAPVTANCVAGTACIVQPPYWTGPFGPFPTGIWDFLYSHQ